MVIFKLNTNSLNMEIKIEGLLINPYKRTVIDKNDKHIYLTAKEFDLLYFLSSHKGQVFTKEQIYENVWDMTMRRTQAIFPRSSES